VFGWEAVVRKAFSLASSPTAGPYTFELLADDLKSLLDVVGVDRTHQPIQAP
jgi:hypothetical protein